jgi:hypothetical protein
VHKSIKKCQIVYGIGESCVVHSNFYPILTPLVGTDAGTRIYSHILRSAEITSTEYVTLMRESSCTLP